MDKNDALKENKGNVDKMMSLSSPSIIDLIWWVNFTHDTYKVVRHCDPDLLLHTDASTTCWGGVLGNTIAGGQWTTIGVPLSY